MKEDMDRLREASGYIQSDDPLVSFLYCLIRDHIPSGVVEDIMINNIPKKRTVVTFTNGWLAEYAVDISRRLKCWK